MPAGLDDLSVLEPDPLVLLGEMAGRPADVVRVLGLARDAGDAEKVLELFEALLACLLQEFFRRSHR